MKPLRAEEWKLGVIVRTLEVVAFLNVLVFR